MKQVVYIMLMVVRTISTKEVFQELQSEKAEEFHNNINPDSVPVVSQTSASVPVLTHHASRPVAPVSMPQLVDPDDSKDTYSPAPKNTPAAPVLPPVLEQTPIVGVDPGDIGNHGQSSMQSSTKKTPASPVLLPLLTLRPMHTVDIQSRSADLQTLSDEIKSIAAEAKLRDADIQAIADGIQAIADDIKDFKLTLLPDLTKNISKNVTLDIPGFSTLSVSSTYSKNCSLFADPCYEAYSYIKKKYPEYLKKDKEARIDKSSPGPIVQFPLSVESSLSEESSRFLGGIGNAFCLGAIRGFSFCSNLYVMRICKALDCI